jgi:hypothetical protein
MWLCLTRYTSAHLRCKNQTAAPLELEAKACLPVCVPGGIGDRHKVVCSADIPETATAALLSMCLASVKSTQFVRNGIDAPSDTPSHERRSLMSDAVNGAVQQHDPEFSLQLA